MADITANTTVVYEDGKCEHTALYAVKNVDAADTVDVAAQFRVVKRAIIVSATGTGGANISTITGTVLTIPVGPLDDAVWMLVVGVAV